MVVPLGAFLLVWEMRFAHGEMHLGYDAVPPGALYGKCDLDHDSFTRCCDTRKGPRGDVSCWGGLYQYSTCCIPPQDIFKPIQNSEPKCRKHFDDLAMGYDRLSKSDVFSPDVLGFPVADDVGGQFARPFMIYLCCGRALDTDALREYCWPDLEELWPEASRNRRAHKDFEKSLKKFVFSRLLVECCEGHLESALESNATSQVLQENVFAHVRSMVSHVNPDSWRRVLNISMREQSPQYTKGSMNPGAFGFAHCCCHIALQMGRIGKFTCPEDSRSGFVHGYAAMFAMNYYYAFRVLEALEIDLPDFDAYLNWGDYHLDDTSGFPIFSQAANYNTKATLLIPDHKVVGSRLPRERAFRYHIEANAYPWELKAPKLFWRGSDGSNPSVPYCAAILSTLEHGYYQKVTSDVHLEDMPPCGADINDPRFGRQRITSTQHPLVDAKFSGSSKFATMRDQAQHKWLLSLDGWANDFRVTWIPLTGSLLVRQRSPVRDWLDVSGLRAWSHYVPVMSNLSDVPKVLSWLSENDDDAAEIARSGEKFIAHRASFHGATEYLYWLFKFYAIEMQAFSRF